MFSDHVAAFWIHIFNICLPYVPGIGDGACAACVRQMGVEAGYVNPLEYDVFCG